MTEAKLIPRRLSKYSNVALLPFHPASHHKDHRLTSSDRRRRHTYLAKDRRSGIADRRNRMSSVYSLVKFLRQKLLNNRAVLSVGKGSWYG
jgi:hypothetical protein